LRYNYRYFVYFARCIADLHRTACLFIVLPDGLCIFLNQQIQAGQASDLFIKFFILASSKIIYNILRSDSKMKVALGTEVKIVFPLGFVHHFARS